MISEIWVLFLVYLGNHTAHPNFHEHVKLIGSEPCYWEERLLLEVNQSGGNILSGIRCISNSRFSMTFHLNLGILSMQMGSLKLMSLK